MVLELYGIPAITFYISVVISTYFSDGAVITYFARFEVLTVVRLEIPFFWDVILAYEWFLAFFSPSIQQDLPSFVYFLTPTNSYNAAACNLLVSYKQE
jgi:hypothetical protein